MSDQENELFESNKKTNAPKKRKVQLTPQIVPTPPADHKQRIQFLNVIYEKLKATKHPTPTKLAMELEKSLALKSSSTTYPMGIRLIIKDIMAGKHDVNLQQKREIHKKLKLRSNLADLTLDLNGNPQFLVSVPNPKPLPKEGIKCERCKLPITSSKKCQFHLMKRQYDFELKRLSSVYPCCGLSADEPVHCEQRENHVFKFTDPSYLAEVHQFYELPNQDARTCLGVDCEMVFTTLGFELIRATFVDFETSELVYDKIVLPKGEVIDFNTRFSGIKSLETVTKIKDEEFQPVSMSQFHSELAEFASKSTILIGHSIENDLTAMRLVHKQIIDTAVLFKLKNGKSISLKELTWEKIGRKIQSGEHSSYEDAKACVDVIKQHLSTPAPMPK